MRSTRHTSGFTLIELLTVVALIAVLAALLLPVLARQRATAARAACISNLSQLARGYQLYSADHDSVEDVPALPGRWWADLAPYVTTPAVYRCPDNVAIDAWATWARAHPDLKGLDFRYQFKSVCSSVETGTHYGCAEANDGHTAPFPTDARAFALGYAQTWYGHFNAEDGTLESVLDSVRQNPSLAILLGESRVPSAIFPFADPGLGSPNAVLRLLDSRDGADIVPDRPGMGSYVQAHAGRTNWLFHDGHVRSLTLHQTLTPRNMWSTRPEDQDAYDELASSLAPEYSDGATPRG